MSLSQVVSRSAVCLLHLLSFLLPPTPLLSFSSSSFPQFCHINKNSGPKGFRVPQAAVCYVCLVYSSVTMVTDTWVFLAPADTFCLPFLGFSLLDLYLYWAPLTSTVINIGWQEAATVEIIMKVCGRLHAWQFNFIKHSHPSPSLYSQLFTVNEVT